MNEPARPAAHDGFAVVSPASSPRTMPLFVGLGLAGACALAVAFGTAHPVARMAEAWRGPVGPFETQGAPAPAPEETDGILRVRLTGAAELYALFVERGFRLETARRGAEAVPRVVVERLPKDLAALESADMRKAVFIKALLPLLLLENERILADRARLERILSIPAPLDDEDRLFLEDLADRYEMSSDRPRELLRRVDAIPVSLAIAQAALETGWGTSRPAQAGHALFGQMVYRDEEDDGRVRRFPDLPGAVQAYTLNLNTHRAYAEFRRARAIARAEGQALDGHVLAQHLQRYSERKMDYVRDVRAVMRANGLRAFDGARLDAEPS
jgi:Bax protein